MKERKRKGEDRRNASALRGLKRSDDEDDDDDDDDEDDEDEDGFNIPSENDDNENRRDGKNTRDGRIRANTVAEGFDNQGKYSSVTMDIEGGIRA